MQYVSIVFIIHHDEVFVLINIYETDEKNKQPSRLQRGNGKN
jgi:hypothetical protein